MCGIYGWQWGNKAPADEQRTILAVMLGVKNDERGGHSYGWWADGRIRRGQGNVAPAARVLAHATAAMAHTRYGTHGEKNIANAHPFEVNAGKEVLVGAHNGVLQNHDGMNSRWGRKFAVDSQHIFQHLVENKPLTDIEGYGTIEYVNLAKPSRIYICRLTNDGVLSVAKTKYGSIWSSLESHLVAALTTAGLSYTLVEVKPQRLHYVEGGTAYITDTEMKLSPVSTPKWHTGRTHRFLGWDMDPWATNNETLDLRSEMTGYDAHGGTRDSADTTNDLDFKAFEQELRYDLSMMDNKEFADKYGQEKFEAVADLQEQRLERADAEGSEDADLVNAAIIRGAG